MVNFRLLGAILGIYIIILVICTGRFARVNKSLNDPYDYFYYVAMVLMSPVFIIHKSIVWIKINWSWLLKVSQEKVEWIFCQIFNFIRFVIYRPFRIIIDFVKRIIIQIDEWGWQVVNQLYKWFINYVEWITKWLKYVYIDVIVLNINYILNTYVDFVERIMIKICIWVNQLYKWCINYVEWITKWLKYVIAQMIDYINYIFNIIVELCQVTLNYLQLFGMAYMIIYCIQCIIIWCTIHDEFYSTNS